MAIDIFKKALNRLEDNLKNDINNFKKVSNPLITHFREKTKQNKRIIIERNIDQLISLSWDMFALGDSIKKKRSIFQIITMTEQLRGYYKKNEIDSLFEQINMIKNVLSNFPVNSYETDMDDFSLSNIPVDINDQINADISELKKCFKMHCYRSVVILCGRILEIILHRKYYEVTGRDLLEKSPGIGLGNLIAKLIDKDVMLDPGLKQQIHLINQVRIFSVHKKKQPFYPSRAQAQAMILFTMDTLEKIF